VTNGSGSPDGTAEDRTRRLEAGSVRVERELERIRQGVERETDDLIRGIENEALANLRAALERARDAHRRLVDELGVSGTPDAAKDPEAESAPAAVVTDGDTSMEGAAPADGGPARESGAVANPAIPSWTAIRRYREGFQRDVIQPLLTSLDRHTPWVAAGRAFREFDTRMASLARRTPSRVERVEPDELYGSDPNDPGIWAARKLAVRSGRNALRLLGAPVRALGRLTGSEETVWTRAQEVELRQLAQDCLRGRPGDLRPALEETWQQVARPLAALESAIAAWNRGWFPFELAVEPVDGHLDEDLRADLAHFQEAAAKAAAALEEAAAEDRISEGEEEGATDELPEPGTEETGGEGREAGGEGREAGEAAAVEDVNEPREAGAGIAEDPEEAAGGADTGPGEGAIEAAGVTEIPGEVEFERAMTAIRGLQDVLEAAPPEPTARARELIRAMAEARLGFFASAVDRAGAFHRVRHSTGRERSMVRAADALERREELWGEWFAAAANRLRSCTTLLDGRVRTEAVHNQLANSIGEEGIVQLADRWIAARDLLLQLHREAASAPELTLEGITRDPGAAAGLVESYRVRAADALEENLLAPLRDRHPGSAVQAVADGAAEALARIPATLPVELTLNSVQSDGPAVHPTAQRRSVPIRELARETLDAFRIEAIRSSASPLLEVLEEAAARCAQIPDVMEYNLVAARDELSEAALTPEAGAPDRGTGEQGVEAPTDGGESGTGTGQRTGSAPAGTPAGLPDAAEIRELTLQGLERSAAGVEALLQVFPPAWTTFANRIHDTIPGTFREVHRRLVAEGMVQEQMLDIRSLLRRRLRSWRRSLGRLVQGSESTFQRLRGWATPLLKRLLRRGKLAVGAAVGEVDGERALEVIRGVPALVSDFPLVYRRLFSFEPVDDPALLSGRDEERAWVRERYEGWHVGRTLPGLIIAEPGAGVTSLFNVLELEDFQSVSVGRVEVDDRVRDESQAASLLGDVLGIDEPAATLDELGKQVLAAPPDSIRSVVFLEGLEYFQSRVGEGSELLSTVVTFQAHVSARVFWLCAIGTAGWSRFSAARPTAATLVAHSTLGLLSREEMEQSILARHRRSGLPVVFQAPSDLSPLKARKIKRADAPEESQSILQEDFFDRVYRTSSGCQAMADVIWLRSLVLNAEEGRATVRAPRPIRFAFLEQLTPDIDFALMAFLEHGSLTMEEYRDILRAPEQEVLRIFEALRTRLLLQAVADEDTIPQPVDAVLPGVTYRVPQILGVAVAARLRSLNILH
jgi:hypothetical protein